MKTVSYRAAEKKFQITYAKERAMEEDLYGSSLTFFSDQQLIYADILPPAKVRARIEVAVLSFLKILTSPTSAISDLPLALIFLFRIEHRFTVFLFEP